ncbi:DUF3606 domain-containing protein [Pedobacter metabolipauper]|uniref:Uncharacterized protein DUF3606 n=1 Tax=Pedobacter metabolipauper TaxID=425513 RepID=A0A4R6SW41_9SPHI|nr:DUF3606 domain-containing protein [Pedobacter metabolipauper]TDQ10030.1 uncharacterized protein DUF3606 [Pedobacter metabolipauper]
MMYKKERLGSPEHTMVDVTEYYEVEYWAKKFEVSPERLRAAVESAGTSADAVKKYLNKLNT